jgi:hypothetical protein
MVINRVGPVSVAKIALIVYGVLGLVFGGIISLFALAGSMIPDQSGSRSPLGALFGVGAIVLLPICYAVIGAIGALIMTGIYNLAARAMGGIELDVK